MLKSFVEYHTPNRHIPLRLFKSTKIDSNRKNQIRVNETKNITVSSEKQRKNSVTKTEQKVWILTYRIMHNFDSECKRFKLYQKFTKPKVNVFFFSHLKKQSKI